ncbi:MAG: tRNA pseudouridine38-40 synthase [Salibacteraceae bacterium]|jgi:tRNA pseudouridine38-40 synthase
MAKFKHYYLIRIAYLGFRLHGWQKQPNVKTVNSMIDRTLRFVFQNDAFKTLGASRTDAMVSASDSAFELFLNQDLPENFEENFQWNLPPDIYFKSIEKVDQKFNIIQSVSVKTYRYFFCFGKKPDPLTASFMAWYPEEWDLDILVKGLKLFEGTHNFKSFCTQPKEGVEFVRTIEKSTLHKNDKLTANFIPEESYYIEFKSKGFVRNQVRLMVGALYLLSTNRLTLETLEKALLEHYSFNNQLIIAHASGLHLESIDFEQE